MSRPLEGIRVLELGNFLAGPFCGLLLGDLGAEVIKIEPPVTGDMTRATGAQVGGESVNFLSVNRNKRSLALDLKQPAGRDVLLRLAETSDLVLENFRPGVMAELGLGIDDVRAVNPDIVYVSVSGFGQTGPYRRRAAVNLIVEAASGSLSTCGEPGGPPMRPGVQTGDMFGALFATYAALAGLMGKVRHGEGRAIDVSLVEASIAAAVWETAEYLGTGNVPQPLGHRHRLTAPYQVLRARDGFIAVGCPNDSIFRRLMTVLGLEASIADPRFASYALRKTNEDALIAIVEPVVSTRAAEELEDAWAKIGVPCARVNDYAQVFDNPQARERDLIVEAPHQRAGNVRMVRNPVLFDRDGPTIDRVAPLLGEHSAEILSEHRYSQAEIDRLIETGVVATPRVAVT